MFKSCKNFSCLMLAACNNNCSGLNVARLSLAGGDFRSFIFTDAELTECDLRGCKLDYARCKDAAHSARVVIQRIPTQSRL